MLCGPCTLTQDSVHGPERAFPWPEAAWLPTRDQGLGTEDQGLQCVGLEHHMDMVHQALHSQVTVTRPPGLAAFIQRLGSAPSRTPTHSLSHF